MTVSLSQEVKDQKQSRFVWVIFCFLLCLLCQTSKIDDHQTTQCNDDLHEVRMSRGNQNDIVSENVCVGPKVCFFLEMGGVIDRQTTDYNAISFLWSYILSRNFNHTMIGGVGRYICVLFAPKMYLFMIGRTPLGLMSSSTV